MSWLSADLVDAMAPQTGYVGPVAGLVDVLHRIEGLGADEVLLIPTSSDASQLHRAADAVAALD